MTAKAVRLATGSADMLKGLLREPTLVSQLPRWAREGKIRKDPLHYRQPWWNYTAIAFISAALPPAPRVFEYGGGASTLWFRDRGASVTTIEDNEDWFTALRAAVPDADMRLVPPPSPAQATPEAVFDDYAHAIDTEPDESLDVVVVDGQARQQCVRTALPKIKPGGLLILDDSQASDREPPPRGDLNVLRWQYREFPTELAGWKMTHLRGLKPGHWLAVQTTVWIKPAT